MKDGLKTHTSRVGRGTWSHIIKSDPISDIRGEGRLHRTLSKTGPRENRHRRSRARTSWEKGSEEPEETLAKDGVFVITHSHTEGHLCCSQFGVIVNKAAVKIHMWGSLSSFPSGSKPGPSLGSAAFHRFLRDRFPSLWDGWSWRLVLHTLCLWLLLFQIKGQIQPLLLRLGRHQKSQSKAIWPQFTKEKTVTGVFLTCPFAKQ